MAVFRVDVGEAVVSDAPPLVPRHAIGGREEFTSVAGAVPGLVTASVRHQWSFAAAAHPSAPRARSEEPLADTRRLPSAVAESWAWQPRAACRNMDSEHVLSPARPAVIASTGVTAVGGTLAAQDRVSARYGARTERGWVRILLTRRSSGGS